MSSFHTAPRTVQVGVLDAQQETPPIAAQKSQLVKRRRALPTCSRPVGEGAKRTRILLVVMTLSMIDRGQAGFSAQMGSVFDLRLKPRSQTRRNAPTPVLQRQRSAAVISVTAASQPAAAPSADPRNWNSSRPRGTCVPRCGEEQFVVLATVQGLFQGCAGKDGQRTRVHFRSYAGLFAEMLEVSGKAVAQVERGRGQPAPHQSRPCAMRGCG